jgi:hypothetical protein
MVNDASTHWQMVITNTSVHLMHVTWIWAQRHDIALISDGSIFILDTILLFTGDWHALKIRHCAFLRPTKQTRHLPHYNEGQ